MIKNKMTKIICASLLLSMVVTSNVFAAGQETYTAYKLPAFQKNNYTGTHLKANDRAYITNKVTAVSNAGTVTFWATDENHDQISGDYYQKVGNTSKLVFTTAGYNKKNKQVCMGMENYEWTFDTAFVSGWANFH